MDFFVKKYNFSYFCKELNVAMLYYSFLNLKKHEECIFERKRRKS